MKSKICVCGAFAFETMASGGQPVKTRELFYALQNCFGKERVISIETLGWKERPIGLLRDFMIASKQCSSIIMLPAHNGLIVFSLLLCAAKKIFGCKIFYDVVGGWLAETVKSNSTLKMRLSKFDGIWVETTTMKKKLSACGLKNVEVVNNFKRLRPLKLDEIQSAIHFPLRFCTFSRVMEEKGIEDAINAIIYINNLNKEYGIVCKLDIYGPIDNEYKEHFEELRRKFPRYINYRGEANPLESVSVLKDYFALLFPTKFKTEGIPGTIIDAYAAAVPVISTRWDNHVDVIEAGNTGLTYAMGSSDELKELLLICIKTPQILMNMKENCLRKSNEYQPDYVIDLIKEYLE